MAPQEKLDAMREMSKARIPPRPNRHERSIADLRASGIMSRVANVGSRPRTSRCPMQTAGRSA